MGEKYIIGIDEAGRGPLAGPVAVGAVLVPVGLNTWDYWHNQVTKIQPPETLATLKDSKKLTEKRREEWFRFLEHQSKSLVLDGVGSSVCCLYSVKMVSASSIDRRGIVPTIKTALGSALKDVATKGYSQGFPLRTSDVRVLLDGGLHAPEEIKNQETIIRGDEKEPAIALASIVAKVTRDRYMCRLSDRYPKYNFAQHKGYGTKAHIGAIKEHGLCKIHRKSFCKNFIKELRN